MLGCVFNFFFFEGESSLFKESFENQSRYAATITSNILKAPEIIAKGVCSSNVLLLLPLTSVLPLNSVIFGPESHSSTESWQMSEALEVNFTVEDKSVDIF